MENIAILALTLLILCSSCRRSCSFEVVPVLSSPCFPLFKCLCFSEASERSMDPLELEDDLRLKISSEDEGGF